MNWTELNFHWFHLVSLLNKQNISIVKCLKEIVLMVIKCYMDSDVTRSTAVRSVQSFIHLLHYAVIASERCYRASQVSYVADRPVETNRYLVSVTFTAPKLAIFLVLVKAVIVKHSIGLISVMIFHMCLTVVNVTYTIILLLLLLLLMMMMMMMMMMMWLI